MKIPFESEHRQKYHEMIEEIFDSNFWTEGKMTERFEEAFGAYVKLPARALSNAGSALMAIFDYIDVKGKDVIVPANTFWATSQAVYKAGGNVVFADCNRDDLCISLEDIKRKVTPDTKAVVVVHIGGHIAFEIEEIARFCEARGIYLVEDCAHVHGAWWNGKTGGHYGFAGAYSFYATKTMPMGEGGMVVSKNNDFIKWVEQYRAYGKEIVNGVVTYPCKTGFNYRMSEFTAALGLIQVDRLPKILEWKRKLAKKYDVIFENRVRFPVGMVSGYYKYIVFNEPGLLEKTGQVFGPKDLGPHIAGVEADIPNSLWVTGMHSCPPIYYGWDHADESVEEIKRILLG